MAPAINLPFIGWCNSLVFVSQCAQFCLAGAIWKGDAGSFVAAWRYTSFKTLIISGNGGFSGCSNVKVRGGCTTINRCYHMIRAGDAGFVFVSVKALE